MVLEWNFVEWHIVDWEWMVKLEDETEYYWEWKNWVMEVQWLENGSLKFHIIPWDSVVSIIQKKENWEYDVYGNE